MDEDGAALGDEAGDEDLGGEEVPTNIDCTKDCVAQVTVADEEAGLDKADNEELEGVDLPNKDTEGNQNGSCGQPSLQHPEEENDDNLNPGNLLDHGDLDDEVSAGLESADAEAEHGELGDDGGDDDGAAQGGVSVVFEESHEKTKPSEEHDMNVDDH